MISPLRITDAHSERTTTQTWPGVCPGHGSIHTLSSKGIVTGYQLRLTTLHDRQQAVLIVRIGGVFGPQFGHPPVLPFLPREQVAGIGECRHPPAVEELRVPTDVI